MFDFREALAWIGFGSDSSVDRDDEHVRPDDSGDDGHTPRRAIGLFAQLTPDQRRRVLAYAGPEASGDQALPKVKRTAA
jgi:hypothetical protein